MVRLLKALADERRLRIVALLAEQELCVCELMGSLGMAQYAVSRALSALKQAGIVSSRREGKWIYYSISNNRKPLVYQIVVSLCKLFPEKIFIEDAERLAHRLRFRVGGKCIYGLEVGDCCEPAGAPAFSRGE